ncbi:MAG: hypothetical protein ACI9JT_000904 [Polaribacter sp.]|jgi:hypothetical protein
MRRKIIVALYRLAQTTFKQDKIDKTFAKLKIIVLNKSLNNKSNIKSNIDTRFGGNIKA